LFIGVKYQVVSRSPLTPLKKGGARVKVPLSNGDLGGSQDCGYITKDLLFHPLRTLAVICRGKAKAHWCQLNVKPIARLGMNSQSNSKSHLKMTEYPENL
jgi:hypothetical protein